MPREQLIAVLLSLFLPLLLTLLCKPTLSILHPRVKARVIGKILNLAVKATLMFRRCRITLAFSL